MVELVFSLSPDATLTTTICAIQALSPLTLLGNVVPSEVCMTSSREVSSFSPPYDSLEALLPHSPGPGWETVRLGEAWSLTKVLFHFSLPRTGAC